MLFSVYIRPICNAYSAWLLINCNQPLCLNINGCLVISEDTLGIMTDGNLQTPVLSNKTKTSGSVPPENIIRSIKQDVLWHKKSTNKQWIKIREHRGQWFGSIFRIPYRTKRLAKRAAPIGMYNAKMYRNSHVKSRKVAPESKRKGRRRHTTPTTVRYLHVSLSPLLSASLLSSPILSSPLLSSALDLLSSPLLSSSLLSSLSLTLAISPSLSLSLSLTLSHSPSLSLSLSHSLSPPPTLRLCLCLSLSLSFSLSHSIYISLSVSPSLSLSLSLTLSRPLSRCLTIRRAANHHLVKVTMAAATKYIRPQCDIG